MTGPGGTHLAEQPALLTPQALLVRAADDLADRFTGVFGKETVERCVFDSYTALARSATVTTHLPTLAVRSAGTRPAEDIDPVVRQVLAEVGAELGEEFPKPLTDDVLRAADVVVTTGCGDACPVLDGERYLDWELDDPEGKSLPRVRAIRDQVDSLVLGLLADLGVRPGPPAARTQEGSS